MRHTIWIAVAIVVISSQIALAQSPAGPGVAPNGSYSSGGVDSVNLYNGNLLVNIPLFSRPGREGLSAQLSLHYNSQGWQTVDTPWSSIGNYTGGFKLTDPTGLVGPILELTDCEIVGGPPGYYDYTATYNILFQFTDGSGARHFFSAGPYHPADGPDACDATLSSLTDLSLPTWVYSPGNEDDWAVYLVNSSGDATVYSPGNHIIGGAFNEETRSGNGLSSLLGCPSSVTDTVGRTIACSGIGTSAWTYAVHDSGGTTRNYVLNFDTITGLTNPVDSSTLNLPIMASVDLPNELSYSFDYDHVQGFMTKITLPTGGYVRFVYAGGNSSTDVDNNYVTDRYVSLDGSTEPLHWTYGRADSYGVRTVTETNEVSGQQTVHTFNSDGYETQTDWKESSSASPTKTVQTTWWANHPATIVTQLGSVKQQTEYSYTYQNRISVVTQSDWYPSTGSVIKLTKTITSYPSSATTPDQMYPTQTELQQWNTGSSSYVTQGKTTYSYDDYSLTSRSGTIPNHTSPYFSDRKNLTKVRHYSDATTYLEEQFHYDDVGNMVEHIDERGKSTIIDFTDNFDGVSNQYSYAYPKRVTDDLGHYVATTVYSYDTGLPLSVTDARSKTTSFTYDEIDRPLTVSGPITDSGASYSYDDTNRKVTTSVVVASGVFRTTETAMDKLGRPIQTKISDPAGDVYVDTEYWESGAVKRVSAPYRSGTPVWTQTDYDVLGRPVTVTNPDSTTATFAYSGNTVTQTDEAGNSRRYTSNALGQLTKVEEPNPNLTTPLVTDYSYYVFGPLQQVTQTGSLTRSFAADWLGRTTSETHPESGNTTFTYDGRLVATRTDARSITTTYGYDDIGRLTSVDYGDSTPDVDYTYDAGSYTGMLTSVAVDGVTSSSFTYGDAGQLLSETVTRSGVSGTFPTSYTYDLGGRLLTATYPSGRVVTQAYAASGSVAGGRLESLTNGPTSTTLVSATADNAAGMLTSRKLSGGITETRSFNPRNQLMRISASANSATLLDLGYGYGTTNNNGKIRARTDAVQPEHSTNYTYDAIGRLIEAGGGDSSWGIAWSLDAYGNRTDQTPSGLASGKVLEPGTAIAYTDNKNDDLEYDDAGNVTYDGMVHYYYDAENRLKEVGSNIEYAYDEAGRRIRKEVTQDMTTVKTYYFYGLTGLMSEFSTSTAQSNATAAASSDRIQYRVGEQTGTGVMLMAADGTPRENNRVFPFGEPWNSNAASDNSEKFTTYQHDNESELDYAMARYYARFDGRFMTPDPGHVGASLGDPQSWNAYIYAGNDPINSIDPSGMCTVVDKVVTENGGKPCPSMGNTVSVTAEPVDDSWRDIIELQLFVARIVGETSNAVNKVASVVNHVIVDLAPAPRDPGCMAKSTLAGAIGGAAIGGAVGAAGIVTGPGVLLTEGGGIAGGFVYGAGAGATLGWSVCMTGTGAPGGGGGYKKPKPGISGKEGAKDVPSWAKGQRPKIGESGKAFAKRLLDGKYGQNNYDKGPTSEFSRIQKWGDRAFE